MAKKEFKVGEVFQCGLVKLKCIEAGIENTCKDCFFNQANLCDSAEYFIGSCYPSEREDETDVIFVKVEDEE